MQEEEVLSVASLSARVNELEQELGSSRRAARQAETDKKVPRVWIRLECCPVSNPINFDVIVDYVLHEECDYHSFVAVLSVEHQLRYLIVGKQLVRNCSVPLVPARSRASGKEGKWMLTLSLFWGTAST